LPKTALSFEEEEEEEGKKKTRKIPEPWLLHPFISTATLLLVTAIYSNS